MARDILNEYGPNSADKQMPRATNGGQCTPKPIPYSPPKGPTSQMRDAPGLGGSVMPKGTQGK